MNARWQEMKKRYWDARSAQEQKLLKVLAVFSAPLLVYLLLWQPAHSNVEKLKSALPALNMQAEKLRSQAAEVEMLRHRPKHATLDAAALKTSIEDSASRHQLREAIASLDLQQPNAVRISLAAVSFEAWLRWLNELQQEQHVRAESLSIAMLPQPGMVKINATLINGGNP